MSRRPAVAPIASAPTPVIATATNVYRNVFTARSPASFQNAIVHILTPTVNFRVYLLVNAIAHPERLTTVSMTVPMLALNNLSSHSGNRLASLSRGTHTSPAINFCPYLAVHGCGHAQRLPACSMAITVLTGNNLVRHSRY